MHVPFPNDDEFFLLNWWPHESIWVVVNSFSIILCCHQWTMIRENSCVCLSYNWWQSVSANNLDMNSVECISLIIINVYVCAHACTDDFFLVEMSVILMIDKHSVTAVELRVKFKTRHAQFFILWLSMKFELNDILCINISLEKI
jgi:hypothetical protein